jgi:hypothetical protein
MVKLVDMPDLGSGAARRVGSSPIIRTKKASEKSEAFFITSQRVKQHEFQARFYFNKSLHFGCFRN